MGWQVGQSNGPDAGPNRDRRATGKGAPSDEGSLPGKGTAPGEGAAQARDLRLAMFASHDGHDAFTPSSLLALAADAASGRGRRCPSATSDERVGLVRAFAALESWAAAGKHGVIAEMIRCDDAPRPAGGTHGDLPDTWSPSLRHELALALACSVQSAETTAWLAWELQARLPGIGALLEDGTLTMPKARAVIDTFKFLTDLDAATAETLILDRLAGKTYPQVLRLAEEAALTVDPELAERRRLQAQKSARVTCFRELSGTAGLSGRDLPPDEALAAMAAVNTRAQHYEDSGAFGTVPMDALRAYAYLDLLTSTPAEDRIRHAVTQDEAAEIAEALAWANTRAARTTAQTRTDRAAAAHPAPAGWGTPPAPGTATGQHDNPSTRGQRDHHSDNEPRSPAGRTADDNHDGDSRDSNDDDDDDGSDFPEDDDGPGPGGPGPCPGEPPPPSGGRAFQKRPPDLIVPLATLLELAEHPGEAQGFGLLDPALARALATAAAASPRTEICVTATNPEGFAIGHGCARPDRIARPARSPDGSLPSTSVWPGTPPPELVNPMSASAGFAGSVSREAVSALGRSPAAGLPARLNLTVPATALAHLAARAGTIGPSSPGNGPWSLIPRGAPPRDPAGTTVPPPGTGTRREATGQHGYGTWTLVLPDGQRRTVRIDSVPTLECDHRYASPGYHPSPRLRHLVQIRDGTCTFPTCNRHARESDFEHAQPFEKGGATCACNAGARSRACHRVKQTPGWHVTQQPRPGWHRWTTPSGRSYTQEPKRYLT